jgi:hypothetical protein
MLDPEDIPEVLQNARPRGYRGALRFYIWRMLPDVAVVGSKPDFIRIRYQFLHNRALPRLPIFLIVFRYRLVGTLQAGHAFSVAFASVCTSTHS